MHPAGDGNVHRSKVRHRPTSFAGANISSHCIHGSNCCLCPAILPPARAPLFYHLHLPSMLRILSFVKPVLSAGATSRSTWARKRSKEASFNILKRERSRDALR